MRGQVMPIWLGKILITAVFAIFIGSYGNMIAYQFRAQAAADSAANAAVALQAQDFNQMEATLFTLAVEEYRLRSLFEGIREVVNQEGGCRVTGPSCADDWATLVPAYRSALYRYDKDAQLLNEITSSMNFGTLKSDATQLVSLIQSACQGTGGPLAHSIDCGVNGSNITFHVDDIQPRPPIEQTYHTNEYGITRYSVNSFASPPNPNMFMPISVEVSVCATVPPIFPVKIFGNLGAPVVVVARAAATDALIGKDWLMPGMAVNPIASVPGTVFQPLEQYGAPEPSGKDWYSVNFGGDPWMTDDPYASSATGSYSQSIHNPELQGYVTWWGPIPILPWNTSSAAVSCS